MKRLITVSLVVLLAATTAFAAGSSETPDDGGTSEPIKLVFWGGTPAEAGPNQAIEAYESIHPSIEIEYVKLGWDDASDVQLVTALMSGTGVDVYIPTRNNLQKAEQGVALDLTPYLERDGIDLLEAIGPEAESYAYNGVFHTIPTVRFTTAWMLNMSLFEEAGIPIPDSDWTIDEFMEIAAALSSGEGAGRTYGAYITSNWGGYWNVLSGGYVDVTAQFNEDFTEARFTAPVIADTLRRFLQMTDVDRSMPSYAESIAESYNPSQMLLTGKAAMVASAQYVLRDVKNLDAYPRDFKIAFAHLPINPDYPNAYVAATLQDPIMINPRSANVEESWQFVKWYFQEGIQYLIPGGRTPAYLGFDPEMVTDIFIAGYEDVVDRDTFLATYASTDRDVAVFNQTVPVIRAVEALYREAENAIVGTKSIEQALADAERAANAILGE